MRTPVEMPKLGYDMERGRISAWVKQVGDQVSRGEVILEVETDKATVEVEALAEGRLVEILHDSGTDLPVGEVIGYLDDEA